MHTQNSAASAAKGDESDDISNMHFLTISSLNAKVIVEYSSLFDAVIGLEMLSIDDLYWLIKSKCSSWFFVLVLHSFRDGKGWNNGGDWIFLNRCESAQALRNMVAVVASASRWAQLNPTEKPPSSNSVS